ncbi:30S ribosomal protein S6 [Patescibacteria group bacterium]
MKKYELTVVLPPGLSSDNLAASIKSIEKLVKSVKGKVVETEDWGEKTLAYTINKYQRGMYRHFVVNLPGEGVNELGGKIKHLPSVMRSLLVVTE